MYIYYAQMSNKKLQILDVGLSEDGGNVARWQDVFFLVELFCVTTPSVIDRCKD
jgi:hypothetical protein